MAARRFSVIGWTPSWAPDGTTNTIETATGAETVSGYKRVSPTFFLVELHSLSMDGVKVVHGNISVEIDTVEDLTGENYERVRQRLLSAGLLTTNEDPTDSLAAAKALRWSEIAEIRDGLETKGFPYLDRWFDSDERSATRINTTAQAAMAAAMLNQEFSTEWVCADNSTIELTRDQIIGLPVAFARYGATLHEKAAVLRKRINAAKSVAEVRECIWEGVEQGVPA